jgi:hypothetical protein
MFIGRVYACRRRSENVARRRCVTVSSPTIEASSQMTEAGVTTQAGLTVHPSVTPVASAAVVG